MYENLVDQNFIFYDRFSRHDHIYPSQLSLQLYQILNSNLP
jgi:hypothetical protein